MGLYAVVVAHRNEVQHPTAPARTTHTHAHSHAHACTRMHTHAHTNAHTQTYKHVHTRARARAHAHIHIHTHIHTHTHTHTCTCARACTRTYMHMHTHTQNLGFWLRGLGCRSEVRGQRCCGSSVSRSDLPVYLVSPPSPRPCALTIKLHNLLGPEEPFLFAGFLAALAFLGLALPCLQR